MRRLAPLAVLLLAALLAWLVLGTSDPGAGPEHVPDAADLERPRSAGGAGTESDSAAAQDAPVTRKRRRATAETPVASASAEEETRRFTLRVVDHADRGVAGVPVVLSDGKGGTRLLTRSDGTTYRDVPLDVTELTAHSDLFEPVTMTSEDTVVRLDDLVPLEIHFVDQETGRPIEVAITGSPLESDNVLSHLGYSVYRTRVAPVRPGRDADLSLRFSPPEGYTLGKGDAVERRAFVSRYAERVRTTVPVAREVKLAVTVLHHDGTPAVDARASASVTGERTTWSSEQTPASGTTRIAGLPFLRGEKLTLYASDEEGRDAPTEEVLLVDADRELAVTLRLPEKLDNDIIGIGGGAGGAFSGRSSKRRVPTGTARLSISATRRNGLPAAGAQVFARGPVSRSGRADEDGRLEFTGLLAGTYTVTLREPGLVATSQDVKLADGEARTMAVRETEGRSATVRVVDADGLPLPNVRLSVRLPWHASHVQIVDGEQELDFWTDVSGRFRFVDLPAAAVTISATLGSRSAEHKLEGDVIDITLPNR